MLTPDHGRVVGLGRQGEIKPLGFAAVTPSEPAAPRREVTIGIPLLLLILPMFGQVFHYMIDAGPLYYLSKAWPVVTLPFAFYALIRLKTRFAGFYIACLLYALTVTPIMSIIWLGNDFGDAITNGVKIWPLSHYFSLIGILVWCSVKPDDLVKSLILLGFGTAGVMILLWYVAPWYWYSWDPAVSRLFLKDLSRGNHIFFPVTFLLLVTFYATYQILRRPRLWQPVFIALSLYIQFYIFKQRTCVATCLLVMVGIVIFRLPKLVRGIVIWGFYGVIFVGGAYVATNLDTIFANFGGSLTVRQTSMALLQKYLGDQPVRWVFGAGGASRMGSVTMADIVGRKDFWLTDLGWAGVLFEFGVVGVLLMLSLFAAVLWWSRRLPRLEDHRYRAMQGAIVAYIAYLAISSLIYSFVYAPGELASMTALLLYLANAGRPQAEPLKTGARIY